jgi:hypothetical protein
MSVYNRSPDPPTKHSSALRVSWMHAHSIVWFQLRFRRTYTHEIISDQIWCWSVWDNICKKYTHAQMCTRKCYSRGRHESYSDRLDWTRGTTNSKTCRLNNFVTPVILLMFAVIVVYDQKYGSPIKCILPTGVSGRWRIWLIYFKNLFMFVLMS